MSVNININSQVSIGSNSRVVVARDDSNNIVTDGLFLYLDAANAFSYPTVGNTWYDLTSNRYNATLEHALGSPVKFNPANSGYIQFDGNLRGLIPSIASGSATGDFSWGCWVNHGTIVGASEHFFMRGRDGFGAGWSLLVGSSGTNPMAALATAAGGQVSAVDGTTTWQANTWYHIFGTWKSGVAIKCYINGVLKATTATTSTILRSSTLGWSMAAIGGEFARVIDLATCMVYNRTLSDSEVSQNFNAARQRFGI